MGATDNTLVVLYDQFDVPMAVANGVPLATGVRGLALTGRDDLGTNGRHGHIDSIWNTAWLAIPSTSRGGAVRTATGGRFFADGTAPLPPVAGAGEIVPIGARLLGGDYVLKVDIPGAASATHLIFTVAVVGTTPTTFLSTNANRRGAIFYNRTAGRGVFLKYFTAPPFVPDVSDTDFTISIAPGGSHQIRFGDFTGIVRGRFSAGPPGGDLQVTELTP